MKLIKLYKSFKIDSICEKYGIKNYTINSDGTIDVDGNINLISKGLTKLPLKFGKVSGYFNCYNNNITSLKGSPKSVGGNFHCGGNSLISLKFCTQSVGGGFYCFSNYLTTLEGCPQSVSGYFSCYDNKLTTLEFCPSSVGGFNCSRNNLISLDFCPQSAGVFNFDGNQLKDLYGFPEFFDGSNITYEGNPVSEILDLFKNDRINKVINFLNEYDVIQQDGKVVVLDRLEEVFHTLNMKIPKINLKNYEVY